MRILLSGPSYRRRLYSFLNLAFFAFTGLVYEEMPRFMMCKVNPVIILLTVLVVKLSYTTRWHCSTLLQTVKHPWTFNVLCPRPPPPNPPPLASMCSLECGAPPHPHPSFFPSHLENKHMKREVWNSADRVGCMCVWVCVCVREMGLLRRWDCVGWLGFLKWRGNVGKI